MQFVRVLVLPGSQRPASRQHGMTEGVCLEHAAGLKQRQQIVQPGGREGIDVSVGKIFDDQHAGRLEQTLRLIQRRIERMKVVQRAREGHRVEGGFLEIGPCRVPGLDPAPPSLGRPRRRRRER